MKLMKTFLKKFGSFIISVAILGMVLLQVLPLVYSSVSTETIYRHSAYEKISVDCVAIRNETPVPLNTLP